MLKRRAFMTSSSESASGTAGDGRLTMYKQEFGALAPNLAQLQTVSADEVHERAAGYDHLRRRR